MAWILKLCVAKENKVARWWNLQATYSFIIKQYPQFVASRFVPNYTCNVLAAKTTSLKAGQNFPVERFRIIGRLNILQMLFVNTLPRDGMKLIIVVHKF